MRWSLGDRIIPARAGSTCAWYSQGHRPSDHPRSRGVYHTSSWTVISVVGSSPLARGLRRYINFSTGSFRIIPARAGSTSRSATGGCESSDHPRSRGVYFTRTTSCTTGRGSSPLARGLLTLLAGERWRGRIIPARAGSTRSCSLRSWRTGDHPRSRGVYARGQVTAALAEGSSPLARGLLPYGRDNLLPYRIIPARAGSTTCC